MKASLHSRKHIPLLNPTRQPLTPEKLRTFPGVPIIAISRRWKSSLVYRLYRHLFYEFSRQMSLSHQSGLDVDVQQEINQFKAA